LIRLKRSGLLVGVSAAAVIGSALSTSAASAGTATAQPQDARFTTQGGVPAQFLPGATTIDHWTFQYTDPTNHVTYPITMVGSDPRAGGSTTIPVVIIPVKLNFLAAGQNTSVLNDYFGTDPGFRATPVTHSFDGTAKVGRTLASPIFQANGYDATLGGDNAQYGDAFMRAQFGKIGTSYHVRLSTSVLLTQTLDVPAEKGVAYVRPAGALTGIAEVTWFSTQLQSLMGSLNVSAKTLPLFLTDNVLLYQKTYDNCCILGLPRRRDADRARRRLREWTGRPAGPDLCLQRVRDPGDLLGLPVGLHRHPHRSQADARTGGHPRAES